MSLLSCKDIGYSYQDGTGIRTILDHVNFDFEAGKMYAILGVSGSGKTTFLSLISGLDTPMSGQIYYQDKDIQDMTLEKYRRDVVGMIFQNYNLIPYMNALQNVLVALGIGKDKDHDLNKKALHYLEQVGIDHEMSKRKITKLSGGEQQRVAIARALCKNATIILADEPTGNLDQKMADSIIALLKKLAHDENKCIIIVTHSERVAKESDVVLRLNTDIKGFEVDELS